MHLNNFISFPEPKITNRNITEPTFFFKYTHWFEMMYRSLEVKDLCR